LSSKTTTEVAVVGGGAAGLMAAISAALQGRSVVLLEGNQRLGRKILISGNGRCNLTNEDADAPEHYHGAYPDFVSAVLRRYTVADTLGFFADMGLECKSGTLGRLFPVTDQASSVLNLLEDRLIALGVQIVTDSKIMALRLGRRFELETNRGVVWMADRVILATGGVSVPKLGADSSGMQMAVDLGHIQTPLYPGLVPLCGGDKHIRSMHGAKVHAALSVTAPTGKVYGDEGDLLFTNYGISGLAVLNLSARIVPHLQKSNLQCVANLFPGHSPEVVSSRLKERWTRNGHQSVVLSLSSMVPDRIAKGILELLQIRGETPVSELPKAARWQIASTLTGLSVEVREPRPFEFAEVTIGGIKSGDVDPNTMESKLVPGVYLAGEMLNVHGDLGGYNFQWAWSSGFIAGLEAGVR
jgi:predicted Rossmann fold flavoprotein